MFGKAVRRTIAVLIGLGVLALIAWALWPQPVPVDMAAIKRGPLEVTVEDEGVTRIREVYTVSAPILGKMLRSPREVGDKVVADKTLVAEIEPTAPTFLDVRSQRVNQAAVQAAQAAVDLAEAKIKEANSQLEFAQERSAARRRAGRQQDDFRPRAGKGEARRRLRRGRRRQREGDAGGAPPRTGKRQGAADPAGRSQRRGERSAAFRCVRRSTASCSRSSRKANRWCSRVRR